MNGKVSAGLGKVLSHDYRTKWEPSLEKPIKYWVLPVGDTGIEPVTSSVDRRRPCTTRLSQWDSRQGVTKNSGTILDSLIILPYRHKADPSVVW